jgi:hypothetical protein
VRGSACARALVRFIIAATEHENMGRDREIFKEVYRLTAEDFMMPAPGPGRERGGKHGKKNANQAGFVVWAHAWPRCLDCVFVGVIYSP